MATQDNGTDDIGRADRGRPWITVLVVVIVSIVAAMLFRQLRYDTTSPQAQGSSDQLMIDAHKGEMKR